MARHWVDAGDTAVTHGPPLRAANDRSRRVHFTPISSDFVVDWRLNGHTSITKRGFGGLRFRVAEGAHDLARVAREREHEDVRARARKHERRRVVLLGSQPRPARDAPGRVDAESKPTTPTTSAAADAMRINSTPVLIAMPAISTATTAQPPSASSGRDPNSRV
jgi:hypothetical protein